MDNIYEAQEEPSEGLDEEVETSEEPESQGDEKTPLKKQEGTIENLQSKHDKFVKEVAQEREAWEAERAENRSKFEQLTRQFEELKNPPKDNTPPQMPQRPADFDWSDAPIEGSSTAKYLEAEREYYAKNHDHLTQLVGELVQKNQQAEQLSLQQKQYEYQKAQTISAFEKEGMTPEASVALWNKLDKAYRAPIDEGAKVFAEWEKLALSQPTQKAKDFDKRKVRKDTVLPPGLDGGGGIPEDEETEAFMKGFGGKEKDNLFETK